MNKLVHLIDSIGKGTVLELEFEDGVKCQYRDLEAVDESIYNDGSLILGELINGPKGSGYCEFNVHNIIKVTNVATGKIEYERINAGT